MGLRKIVAYSQSSSQCLSCFNSFWHGIIPTSYFIFNDFYTCSTHFFSHKYGQDAVGSLASHERARYSACAIGQARALCRGDVACAIRTKWRLRHPETPVELSVSLFDSLGEFICSKGSSSIGCRVEWCLNHSSVGVVKKKKKEKIDGGLTDFHV